MMKSALVWIGIIALVLIALNWLPQNNRTLDIPFSQFYTEGVEGRFKSVTLTGVDIEGVYKSPEKNDKGEVFEKFKTIAPPIQNLGQIIIDWKMNNKLDEFKAAKPS